LLNRFYHKAILSRPFFGISLSVILLASIISIAAHPSPAEAFTGNCANIPVKNFYSAALEDSTLGKREKAPSGTVLTTYVKETLGYMKMHGINSIRVPFYWEAYVNNPTVFLAEMDLVAKTAQANGMCVVFANFHYHTTSYWNLDGGRGFPSVVVDEFPKKADYKSTAGPFWEKFLSNNIMVNGKKVWDYQWDFLSKAINKVKGYNSVAGFEILNEPHLFAKSQYDKLGNYHTFMAKKIRAITDKKIFFARETAWGFVRDPTMEHKIVPDGVSKLVYSPQLYAIPYSGSVGMKQINNFKSWSQNWGTEVLVSEWAADTSSEALAFLKAFKANGFGWTETSWQRSGGGGLGVLLYQSSTVPRTDALKILVSAMQTVY